MRMKYRHPLRRVSFGATVVTCWLVFASAQYYDLDLHNKPCCDGQKLFGIFRDNFIIMVTDPQWNYPSEYVHCVHDRTQGGDDYWVGYQCVGTGVDAQFTRWEYGPNDQCQNTPIANSVGNRIRDTVHGGLMERCCSLEHQLEPCGKPAGQVLPPVPVPPTPSPTIAATTTSATATTTTRQPSFPPTRNPTQSPSNVPTAFPSRLPTAPPTTQPTASPTHAPTNIPSLSPTRAPTADPSRQPSFSPTTWAPTRPNQKRDTRPPTSPPSRSPSRIPTHSPTDDPSFSPSINPTLSPSTNPSESPTQMPTASTKNPTYDPSFSPTESPSRTPSRSSTKTPTDDASRATTRLLVSDDEQGDDLDQNNDAARSAMRMIRAQVMPSVPVHAVCLLLVLLFFVLLLRKFFQRAKDTERQAIQKSVRVAVVVTFVSNMFGIASMVALTTMMMTAEQWDEQTWKLSFVAISCVSVGYIAGKAALQVFYILRVYNAFRDSSLAMSKCTVACLLLLLLFVALIWLFLLVIDQAEWDAFDRDYDYLILSALDTLLVGFLLALFVKKLNVLVMMQKSECVAEMETSSQGSQPATTSNVSVDSTQAKMHRMVTRTMTVESVKKSLNQRQTKLIFITTRCIILNLVAFVTTIMFGFFAFYYVRNGTHVFFLYSAWSMDMLINSICLYLNFAFAADLYGKCCGCCHSQCQRLMEYCAAKQILRDHQESIQKQMSAEDTNE